MKRLLILPPALMILLFFSCGGERSRTKAGILPEKKMIELLVDTHLVDALLSTDSSQAQQKRDKGLSYYPSLLEKYGITKAQMDSSVAWYMRNPPAYSRVYEAVLKELQDRKAKATKDLPKE